MGVLLAISTKLLCNSQERITTLEKPISARDVKIYKI